jgi:hypothetical protein
MQLKSITAIAVLLLVVASLSVAGCTTSNTSSPTATATPTATPTPILTTTGTTSQGLAISISSPSNGGNVGKNITVQGIARGLPNDQTLWLIVVPKSITPTRYYPVNTSIPVPSDGTWSKAAFIGSDNDVGQQFDIKLVSANQTADSAFMAYFATGASTGVYPGMLTLPQGTTNQSSVTVTRT